MIEDATCTPADIRYPTDMSILNEARMKTESFIDYLYKEFRELEDFYLPFGGHLDEENRWVILSKNVPWEKIEKEYKEKLCDTEKGHLPNLCVSHWSINNKREIANL